MSSEIRKVSKGNANRRSLGDRMKTYEAITTERKLIEQLPIYGRIDMRAGHSFCRNLNKPFDLDYVNAMKTATAYVVEETGAVVASTQSDEASFLWLDDTKVPFGTRLFKLESVIASMFTSVFFKACLGTSLEEKALSMLPTFDFRCCNLPSLSEAVGMFLWRERDSIKNSITLLALEHFSNREIHKKNSDDKIQMLKEIGVDYYTAIPEDLRNGAYFRRELYQKTLTEEELLKIPEYQKKQLEKDENGNPFVIRSHVVQFYLKSPLSGIMNREKALFFHEEPIRFERKAENESGEEEV